jgi:ribosomal protein S18 acetylase RimI-like enzyme
MKVAASRAWLARLTLDITSAGFGCSIGRGSLAGKAAAHPLAPRKKTKVSIMVRMAVSSDLDALVSLVCSFRDHLGQSFPKEPEITNSLRRLLSDPETDFLIALESESPIGYVQLRYRDSLWISGREAQIDDLWVSAVARHRGVGRQLVEAAIARSRERECALIGLNSNALNHDALRLYARAGFSAERPRWPGGQQLWLERPL